MTHAGLVREIPGQIPLVLQQRPEPRPDSTHARATAASYHQPPGFSPSKALGISVVLLSRHDVVVGLNMMMSLLLHPPSAFKTCIDEGGMLALRRDNYLAPCVAVCGITYLVFPCCGKKTAFVHRDTRTRAPPTSITCSRPKFRPLGMACRRVS